jgi:hypothetical protein
MECDFHRALIVDFSLLLLYNYLVFDLRGECVYNARCRQVNPYRSEAPMDPVERLLEAIYSRSPGFVQRLFGEISYWICELLCGFVARRTSCEKLNAASAIAVVQALDVKALIAVPESELPERLVGNTPPFTPAEWKEVLSLARDNRQWMEQALQSHPEWSHLRKTPAT